MNRASATASMATWAASCPNARNTLLNELSSGGDATVGEFAWATFLGGQPDSAAAMLAPSELALSTDLEWRYRMGHIYLDRDHRKAFRLLFPLAVLSRKQDSEVMGMLRQAATEAIPPERVAGEVDRAIHTRDVPEAKVLERMAGARVMFPGRDGFPLSGIVVAAPSARAQRGAVILMAPGDTIASYDSLAIELRRAGFASILLEPRGSGRSVGEDCPLPSTWRGREEFMHTVVADDIAIAFQVLTRHVRVDTTRYAILASGATASIGAEAAARDRRVKLLLLASPNPAPVDRGPMRAWVAARSLPLFLVTAPEDYLSRDLVERLYAVTNRGASRVVEARVPGSGAQALAVSRDTRARMVRWLKESWPVTPATRPTSPKKR